MAAGSLSTARVLISGEANETVVSQFRGDALSSDTTQIGQGNILGVIQFGNDGEIAESTVRQNGNGNFAEIIQGYSGPHTVSMLTMEGNDNRAQIYQESSSATNLSTADITGDTNSLKVHQTGSATTNEEHVAVMGSDNAVTVDQLGFVRSGSDGSNDSAASVAGDANVWRPACPVAMTKHLRMKR